MSRRRTLGILAALVTGLLSACSGAAPLTGPGTVPASAGLRGFHAVPGIDGATVYVKVGKPRVTPYVDNMQQELLVGVPITLSTRGEGAARFATDQLVLDRRQYEHPLDGLGPLQIALAPHACGPVEPLDAAVATGHINARFTLPYGDTLLLPADLQPVTTCWLYEYPRSTRVGGVYATTTKIADLDVSPPATDELTGPTVVTVPKPIRFGKNPRVTFEVTAKAPATVPTRVLVSGAGPGASNERSLPLRLREPPAKAILEIDATSVSGYHYPMTCKIINIDGSLLVTRTSANGGVHCNVREQDPFRHV